jgi:hypothetical protein
LKNWANQNGRRRKVEFRKKVEPMRKRRFPKKMGLPRRNPKQILKFKGLPRRNAKQFFEI